MPSAVPCYVYDRVGVVYWLRLRSTSDCRRQGGTFVKAEKAITVRPPPSDGRRMDGIKTAEARLQKIRRNRIDVALGMGMS